MCPIIHRSAPLVIAMMLAQLSEPVRAAAPDDACVILTPAQVGAAVGVAVSDGTYVTPTFKKTCTWTVANSAGGIRFVTLNLQGVDQFAGGKGGANAAFMTPIGGIGDDAYFLGTGGGEGLFVKKGQRAFKIDVYTTLPIEKKRDMEKALAQQVLTKL